LGNENSVQSISLSPVLKIIDGAIKIAASLGRPFEWGPGMKTGENKRWFYYHGYLAKQGRRLQDAAVSALIWLG
jgi:hypothetical protein